MSSGGLFRRQNTHRFSDGRLATTGKSKIKWARITPSGRVHRVDEVIIRWNFKGGTREKPDMTFVALCGPQRHSLYPAELHHPIDRCARCEAKAISRD